MRLKVQYFGLNKLTEVTMCFVARESTVDKSEKIMPTSVARKGKSKNDFYLAF